MRMVEIPPIRRLFVPKDGYVLFEADLKRADPQVCAKESGEEALLEVFREGQDVYTEMGKWLYEKPKLSTEERQWNKNAINGINYAAMPKTMAATLHTTIEKAEKYIERWRGPTGLYPGIGRWHRHIDSQLHRTNTVYNVYGFRRFYTDRLDSLLPKALAWICSSAVSITIDRGMKHVFGPNVFNMAPVSFNERGEVVRSAAILIEDEDRFDPWSGREYVAIPQVELLMQIHDSIIGQFPRRMENELMPIIKERMELEIPYEGSPLTIPITFKVGIEGEAWGDLDNWKEAA